MRSLWWPTYINTMADLISRMLDANGNEIASVRDEFECENAKLEKPDRILQPEEIDPRVEELVSWMGGLNHAFSVLQGIPLRSDLCGPIESTPSYTTQVGSVVYSMEDHVRQAQVKRLTQAGIEAGERNRQHLPGVKGLVEVERVTLSTVGGTVQYI